MNNPFINFLQKCNIILTSSSDKLRIAKMIEICQDVYYGLVHHPENILKENNLWVEETKTQLTEITKQARKILDLKCPWCNTNMEYLYAEVVGGVYECKCRKHLGDSFPILALTLGNEKYRIYYENIEEVLKAVSLHSITPEIKDKFLVIVNLLNGVIVPADTQLVIQQLQKHLNKN